MTTRQKFLTRLAVALVFVAALLVVGHAAHAGTPMPITCHEVAHRTAAINQAGDALVMVLIIIVVVIFV
jgi:hypothetical protein